MDNIYFIKEKKMQLSEEILEIAEMLRQWGIW